MFAPNATASTLRLCRVARNFSQQQLASRAGVSRGTVIRLERGGRPNRLTAKALAEAIGGISVDDLFPKAEEP